MDDHASALWTILQGGLKGETYNVGARSERTNRYVVETICDFVDEMVPHHEGAIAMARAVLKETRDPELRKLAQDIIRAQEREISEMNAFRKREYGGGAPREATPSVHGEHGG